MSYNADSIQIKDFRSACRSTPGMYIGTDGQDAAFNCFLEVLNNACDEAMMGRGNKITIILSDDCDTIECIDRGAGVPHGPNKDTNEVLVELFTSAHSSGKFDTSNYKKVRGCHGIGTSAVCVCSTNFEVWSRRDGEEYYLAFKDGIPQTSIAQKVRNTNETGSTFKFTPDKQIFNIQGPSFDFNRLKEELELTSYFIPGVNFELIHKDKKFNFVSKEGLKDFAKNRVAKPLHKSYIYGYKQFDDEVEVEVFAQWTGGKETSYVFSNGALNIDGGTPETGAKTAFTRTINSLSKGEFEADMIRKGLVYIINIRHPHPIYQNQTKTKIQNSELRGYTQTVFTEAIKEFVLKHRDEFDKIVGILVKEKKAEAAAERARKQVLEMQKDVEKAQKAKIAHVDKLQDARKLGPNATLVIVEGESAGGSVAMGRGEDIGILKLRGKMLNLEVSEQEDWTKNEEVQLLQQALGIVYGKPYNPAKLRYGKVAIASDADSDGSHISMLVTINLWNLCPELIMENRLYRLEAPLYKVHTSKKNYYYYTEEEFSNKKEKGDVIRYKGLGQMEPEDLKGSMFSPEFQRLTPYQYTEEGITLLKELMGKDVTPKKDFVFSKVDFANLIIE